MPFSTVEKPAFLYLHILLIKGLVCFLTSISLKVMTEILNCTINNFPVKKKYFPVADVLV